MRHLHFSYVDLVRLPVRYRSWFIDRLSRDMSPQNSKSVVGGIELDDDVPISQVLSKMNRY